VGAEAKTDKTYGLSKNSITNTNNVRSQFANDINNKYRHVTISTNAYINKMKSKSKLKQSKNSNNE
jgi:hypothetical protein